MFHSARIKLTAWYLIIIMAISITFSLVIYQGIIREVERFDRSQRNRIERRLIEQLDNPQALLFTPTPPNPELVEEAERRVLTLLILLNATILIISGGLGYLLAGRTLKPIQEMLIEQNRFIADASHELRTPITSLKSSIEVFLRTKSANLNEAKEILLSNLEEVDQLEHLTNDLLQLTKYEAGSGHNHFASLQIDSVIEKSVKKINPIALKKQINISTKTIKKEIIGNEDSLIKLFTILLENAVKYSPKKSVIDIQAITHDTNIVVEVSDSGPGISREDLTRIFDRFYRSDTSRSKSNVPGYGLGLAIAKKIVEDHGGEISAKSVLSEGATFTVKLPLKGKS